MPFYPFFGEGSPTKIDYREKGTLILNSLLEDLVEVLSENQGPASSSDAATPHIPNQKPAFPGSLSGDPALFGLPPCFFFFSFFLFPRVSTGFSVFPCPASTDKIARRAGRRA